MTWNSCTSNNPPQTTVFISSSSYSLNDKQWQWLETVVDFLSPPRETDDSKLGDSKTHPSKIKPTTLASDASWHSKALNDELKDLYLPDSRTCELLRNSQPPAQLTSETPDPLRTPCRSEQLTSELLPCRTADPRTPVVLNSLPKLLASCTPGVLKLLTC